MEIHTDYATLHPKDIPLDKYGRLLFLNSGGRRRRGGEWDQKQSAGNMPDVVYYVFTKNHSVI